MCCTRNFALCGYRLFVRYEVPRARVDAALRALPELLNDPALPFYELQEALSPCVVVSQSVNG
jgi:hypothetical protein